jgi:cysteine-rich repeat protein
MLSRNGILLALAIANVGCPGLLGLEEGQPRPEAIEPNDGGRTSEETEGSFLEPTDAAPTVADAQSEAARDAAAEDVTTTDVIGDRDSEVSLDPRDGAAPDGATAVCGNGIIEGDEICDDGNRRNGDGCSAHCDSMECFGDLTYEDQRTHHCYRRFIRIYDDIVPRDDAALRCFEWGRGYLARLETAAEREAIQSTVMTRGYSWIGLRSFGGDWRWDGATTSAEPASLAWLPQNPTTNGPCVEWNASPPGFRNVSCSLRRDFVCEREPIGVRR